MRLCYHVLIPTSFLLILPSCAHSYQRGDQAANDSLFENEIVAIPVSEIDIKGKWESKNNPFYPILEFKGKSTVVITTIMGPFATSYERDEEFIRVRTDKSDLLFEVISNDSIVGSGFAKGTWIKDK